MTLTMTKPERELFLAEAHVGVLAVAREDGTTLATPIWYAYEPGGTIAFVSGRDNEKTKLVQRSGRASLCAQTETLPYKYVTVEGSATIGDDVDEDERRAIAERYLGVELAAGYIESTKGADNVTIRITPERWRTTDFGKEYSL